MTIFYESIVPGAVESAIASKSDTIGFSSNTLRSVGIRPLVVVRYRGIDWIYTYLRSFYWDPGKPGGWNNHIFPGVAMPNVLFSYSGTVDDKGQVIKKAGYTSQEYDQKTADLMAWMRYTSDPSIIVRRQIAPYVIGFLVIFTIFAYLLKRAYWRDVH